MRYIFKHHRVKKSRIPEGGLSGQKKKLSKVIIAVKLLSVKYSKVLTHISKRDVEIEINWSC